MSARRAPTVLRMPISRVRSVTDTSMMFITPIPPTRSEMAATAPSKVVNTWLVAFEVWIRVAWFTTVNPGAAAVVLLVDSRVAVASSSAAVVVAEDVASRSIDENGAVAGDLVLHRRCRGPWPRRRGWSCRWCPWR